jgi:hypothetical protein
LNGSNNFNPFARMKSFITRAASTFQRKSGLLPFRAWRWRTRSAVHLLLVAALTTVLSFATIEVFHRFWKPHRALGGAHELQQFRQDRQEAISTRVTVDPDFGFRPILPNRQYSRFGTLKNDYPESKAPGLTRLLFIGDSVTRRGQIVEALRAHYPSWKYEFWNAGVESFNTVQEVAYYRRFNRPIRPDHVILTFHLNDFETTPVAFRDSNGKLVVYAPNLPLRQLSPWLFEHSYVYRYWLGFVSARKSARTDIITEARTSLAELQRLVADDNAQLTVLVLPILTAQSQWKPEYHEYRRQILEILESLKIRHFDLLNPLNKALAAGAVVTESGDYVFWHPSAEAAAFFAKYLHAERLFE